MPIGMTHTRSNKNRELNYEYVYHWLIIESRMIYVYTLKHDLVHMIKV